MKRILERERNLLEKLTEFLKKYQKPRIDLIAVTIGPGLEPCLWVGINFAKALSFFWNLPVVEVNHIEAHILANWINWRLATGDWRQKILPAVCLVASGGHTELFLMKDIGKYKLLGETRDDAAGECLDKVARILGLPYPGGPSVAKMATKIKNDPTGSRPDAASRTPSILHRGAKRQQISKMTLRGAANDNKNINGCIGKYPLSDAIKLPRPMINSEDYDFSFSGLKTAVLYKTREQRTKNKEQNYISNMCVEVQQAVIDVLISKTLKATKEFKVKTILLGGGVISNKELRKQFNWRLATGDWRLIFLVPPKKFCTDNAAMVGVVGYFKWLSSEKKDWQKIKAKANLKINGNKL